MVSPAGETNTIVTSVCTSPELATCPFVSMSARLGRGSSNCRKRQRG